MASVDWTRIEAEFGRLSDMSPGTRQGELARIASRDPELARELKALLAEAAQADPLLDRPAIEALGPAAMHNTSSPSTHLAPGTRIGAWRIVDLIGRGGMGEVYRAERADGEFEQEAALKRMRADAAPTHVRFHVERQILAQLDHPGIARLLDGGLDAGGHPFMVMELVHGVHIHRWASEHAATLEQRLGLFVQLCDAVAYAHRHLVVHRDIKPANVIVTDDGCPKLLDFGIARMLDGPAGLATRELMLTPAYAAPEQLNGGTVTTAADVYSLGLLLYELLVGSPGYAVNHLPMASAMHLVLTQPLPLPSQAVRESQGGPISAQILKGDLDAIVSKAVRKEPAQRFASVDEMRADVERFLRHEVVTARKGGWTYVFGRTLRRHRVSAAALAAAAGAILIGGATAVWQAELARAQADRANAVSGFLVDVFKASDPRIAASKPRGQATARELLDAGAARLNRDFATQPQIRVGLLGLFAGIYQELGEKERYLEVQAERERLLQQWPGRYPGAEVEIELNQVEDGLLSRDSELANRHLELADDIIRRRGIEGTVWRARWWIFVAQASARKDLDKRMRAAEQAIVLLRQTAPSDCALVDALYERATVQWEAGGPADAAASLEAADRQYQSCEPKDDSMEASVLSALATSLDQAGRYDQSLRTYERAEALALQTTGEHDSSYWEPLANHALKLHAAGDRTAAMERFAILRALIPFPPQEAAGWEVYHFYARCLSAQGEPDKALPFVEAIVDHYQRDPLTDYSQRLAKQALGLTLARLGRNDEARLAFQAAFDDYRLHEAADRPTRLQATAEWARFLVDQGNAATARGLFEEILRQDHERHLQTSALAHAGLARVELADGHAVAALEHSTAAIEQWSLLSGARDVREGAYVERVHARCLIANGDRSQARVVATKALEQNSRYDVDSAGSISEATALIAAAGLAPGSEPARAVNRP